MKIRKAAGVLNLITAAFPAFDFIILLPPIFRESDLIVLGFFPLILTLAATVLSAYAGWFLLRNKRWRFALLGSMTVIPCTVLWVIIIRVIPVLVLVNLIGWIMSVAAITLSVLAKKEFTRVPSGQSGES